MNPTSAHRKREQSRLGGSSTPAPSTAVHALPFSLKHNVHYRTLLAALSLFVPNVTQRFAVCRERQTTPFGVRARRPTTVPIMCVMFACFARREFSSSLRQAVRPGARSLRKRPRGLSAPRLLASGAGLSRFRLSQVVFSTAFKFFGVRFFLVASPPPGNKSREGPRPFPQSCGRRPAGGRRPQAPFRFFRPPLPRLFVAVSNRV